MDNQLGLFKFTILASLLVMSFAFVTGELLEAVKVNSLWLQVSKYVALRYTDSDCGFADFQSIRTEATEIIEVSPRNRCGEDRAWARLAFYSGAPNETISLLTSPDCCCGDLTAIYFLGSAYVQIGDLTAAQTTWWDHGPHNCLYRLGQRLARESNHAQAIAIYHRVLVLDPGRSYVLRDLARSYAATGDLVSAEKSLLAALDLQPNESFTLYEIADLLVQQKQYERAIDYYVRAIYGDVPQFRGFIALTNLALREGRVQKAQDWCKRAGEALSPSHALLCEGRVAYAQGDYPAAVTLLQEAVRGLDQDKDAMFWLGLALLQVGDVDEANRMFEQSASALSTRHYQDLGEVYERLGDISAALHAYEQALVQRPMDQDLKRITDRLRAQLEQ